MGQDHPRRLECCSGLPEPLDGIGADLRVQRGNQIQLWSTSANGTNSRHISIDEMYPTENHLSPEFLHIPSSSRCP